MASVNPEVINNKWEEFVARVLKPKGLDTGLNGDTEPLRNFLAIRMRISQGDEGANDDLQNWTTRVEQHNQDFFEEKGDIIRAIRDYIDPPGRQLKPGQKTRGFV